MGCVTISEMVATHSQFAAEKAYASEDVGFVIMQSISRLNLYNTVFLYPRLISR